MSAAPWGETVEPPVSTEPVRPPKALLLAAGMAVAVSAVLLVPRGLPVNVVGYGLAGFVAIGLVTTFSRIDNRRRLDAWYAPEPGLRNVLPFVSAAALLVSAAHAWHVATRLAS